MLARIHKSMKEKDEGFTLIELLVVMIIIGILAAIAIPVFLNQRAKAQDSATKADVTTLGKEIATYFVDNTAAPTVVRNGENFEVAGQVVGRRSQPTIDLAAAFPNTATATSWCIALVNTAGSGAAAADQTWKYSAAGGLQKGVC